MSLRGAGSSTDPLGIGYRQSTTSYFHSYRNKSSPGRLFNKDEVSRGPQFLPIEFGLHVMLKRKTDLDGGKREKIFTIGVLLEIICRTYDSDEGSLGSDVVYSMCLDP